MTSVGTRVLFVNSLLDTEYMDNDLIISIVESFAQAENETRSENIRMGHKYHAENGTSGFYNRKCYGYTHDEKGLLIIKEEEAEKVRLIFKLYLSGYSIGGIIKELKKRNITSPTGRENWYKGTIDNILSNEKYIGDVELFKSDETTPTYLATDNHPAIIPRNIFQAVQLEKQARTNIEESDGVRKRKHTKYSSKQK